MDKPNQPFGAEDRARQIFDTDPSGAAYDWLNRLFGSWVGDLVGAPVDGVQDSATILTTAASYANALALILGSAIVAYVVLASVVKTAHEGQILGRSWSSVWLPIRTSGAMLMILPVAGGAGHVSGIQAVVMWLAITGSNAADVVWDAVVDKAVSTPIVSTSPVNGVDIASRNFRAAACAVAMTQSDGAKYPTTLQYGPLASGGAADYWRPTDDLATAIGGGNGRDIHYARGGFCGDAQLAAYAQGVASGQAPATFERRADALAHEAARRPITQMLARNMTLAREVIGPSKGGWKLISEVDEGNDERLQAYGQRLRKNGNDFARGLEATITTALAEDQTLRDMFQSSLTADGWGYAGLFYWQLDKFAQSANAAKDAVASSVTYASPTNVCDGFFGGIVSSVANWFRDDDDKEARACDARYDLDAAGLIATEAAEQSVDGGDGARASLTAECDASGCDPAGYLDTFAATAAARALSVAGAFGGDNASTSRGDGTADPYATVTGMGHAMVTTATVAMGAVTAIEVIQGTSETTPFAGGIGGALEVATKGLYALVWGSFAMGWVLAYVIPFLPTFIWVSQILAWLLMVIEAIVASPLHMIMAAMPEGEGISGQRQERGYALLMGLALRPPLMVIGLVASIAVGVVALGLFNDLFRGAAELYTSWGLFEFLSLISMYVVGIFFLTRQVFSIMYRLPDQLLEWISSGGSRQLGESEFAGDVGSTQRAAGAATGAALGAGAGAARDAMTRKPA